MFCRARRGVIAEDDPYCRLCGLHQNLHRRAGWNASLHAGQDQTRWRSEPGDEIDADVQNQIENAFGSYRDFRSFLLECDAKSISCVILRSEATKNLKF